MTGSSPPALHHHFPKFEAGSRCVRCSVILHGTDSETLDLLPPCAEDRPIAIANIVTNAFVETLASATWLYGKLEGEMILGILFNIVADVAVRGRMSKKDFLRLAETAHDGMMEIN